MTTDNFSVTCQVCGNQVIDFSQHIKYTLTPTQALQGSQTIYLSCSCIIDYPDWDIDLNTGWCQLKNFAGTAFIKFFDEELLSDFMEGEE